MANKNGRNIAKRKALRALYEKGKEVRFGPTGLNTGDPAPDDIVIMVVPPNPAQRDEAIREAQAARAVALLKAKDPETAEHKTATVFVADMSIDELVEYVLALDEPKRQQEAQRRVLAKDEWKDFDELRDAMRRWEEADFPETEEWAPLAKRDKDFGKQVNDEMRELYDSEFEATKMQPRPELERKAFERRVEVIGTGAFMKVFEEMMLYFACREEEDHDELFFETSAEIRTYPEHVEAALTDAFHSFINDLDDAKN